MPFTFSHPALVVPLLRFRQRCPWLSATGLVTGSIAPDCEKFLRLRLASNHSHTFNSIFYFSCPVALVLAFVFHLVVRKPLITHLPSRLYRRLNEFITFDWMDYFRKYYWGVILSIIIGAMLHLLWDSFTHPSPLIDHFFPILAKPVWMGNERTYLFYMLGLVSSVLGGAFILWFIWKMPLSPVSAVPTTRAVLHYWGFMLLVTIALATQWILVTKPELLDGGIAVISSSLISLVATSLYTTYTNRKLVHEQL